MLNRAVKKYLAIRRTLGFKLHSHERLLSNFASFAAARGERHVRSKSAIEWAAAASSPVERDWRLSVLSGFACHARAEDLSHEVPPKRWFGGRRQRPLPYIFSRDDVRLLLEAATSLRPTGSRRPHTYRTLFGLLVSTGLRISEALALRLDDVTPDGLVIRRTKFRKSRMVPLHQSTAAVLRCYITQERCLGGICVDDHLFVSLRGRRYSYGAVRDTFVGLLLSIGLDPTGRTPRPHLHCLRHTFAVRALERCPIRRGRETIERQMCALSTYLGHSHVADTYWYLEATPQLMIDIAKTCEAFHERA